MIPLPSISSLLPSYSSSVPAFYFLLHLAAYALLSTHLMKRVKLELRACRLDALRVSQLEKDVLVREKESLEREKDGLEREKERLGCENERMVKEREAQSLAFNAEVEEMQGVVAALKKSNEDAEARVLEQKMEFLDLKAKWAGERDELQKENTLVASQCSTRISALAEQLQEMERDREDQKQQIRSLAQAKEVLEKTNGDLRDKTLELGDKLYEYHTQFTQFVTGDPLAVFRDPPTSDFGPANREEGEGEGEQGAQQTQSADSSPCWNLYKGVHSPPRSPYRHERSHARALGLFNKMGHPEPGTVLPTEGNPESTEEKRDLSG